MARTAKVSDQDLMERLAKVFRNYGYEGASMTVLSKVSGLQKASLYHRFPGGKEEMAQSVLDFADNWIAENIVAPLRSKDGKLTPEKKIKYLVKQLDNLYNGGNESCLLNMLSHPTVDKGPFSKSIKNGFKGLISTISVVLEEKGVKKEEAQSRATTALTLLQGGLVLSRGMGSTKPFKNALLNIEKVLLDSTPV
jgi:AcrR family transcriptional regulator